jgi:hypothetical protein
MQIFPGWDEATVEQKEQIVRLLNGDKHARWPFPTPPVRVLTKKWKRAWQRIQHGLPVQPSLESEVRADRKLFVEHYRRIGKFYEWREGIDLPADVRRCQCHCSKFFLVSKSQPTRKYYLPERCGRNFRSLKSTNKTNHADEERKLKRVRTAMKACRRISNWKKWVARRARVKSNFITYWINRGKLTIPARFKISSKPL